jgi:hypothetical protein
MAWPARGLTVGYVELGAAQPCREDVVGDGGAVCAALVSELALALVALEYCGAPCLVLCRGGAWVAFAPTVLMLWAALAWSD